MGLHTCTDALLSHVPFALAGLSCIKYSTFQIDFNFVISAIVLHILWSIFLEHGFMWTKILQAFVAVTPNLVHLSDSVFCN